MVDTLTSEQFKAHGLYEAVIKTVHLIRHAKSSWDNPSLSDRQRPLNRRGQRACELMAQPMVSAGCTFSTVFCSPARRAQLTMEGIRAQLPTPIDWQIEDALYTFDQAELWRYCRQLREALTDVVLVGHNPAMTQFCRGLSNASITHIPTCGYAQIAIPIESWPELTLGSGRLSVFLTPKMMA